MRDSFLHNAKKRVNPFPAVAIAFRLILTVVRFGRTRLFVPIGNGAAWPGLVPFCLAWFLCGCQSGRLPFYPIGIYSVGTNDLEVVREAGFNVVRGPARVSYLDAAASRGLRVLAEPGTAAGTNFNALRARSTITRLESHPALWAWYLIDEPDLNQVSPDDVRQANRFLKSLPARKPTALVLYQGAQALHYAGLSDILMIDRYPVPWLPLANFPQHVRMAKLAAGDRQPLIAVVQAFDWSYYPNLLGGEKNLRPPTHAELRCMTYCALAQRANGLFYYCFNDGRWRMEDHPREWGALRSVVAEVNERLPLFEADHLWHPVVHAYQDTATRFNAALESSVTPAFLRVTRGNKSVPSGDYLLAVNTTDKRLDYRIKLPSGVSGSIPMVGTGRSVQTLEGWLADSFEAYAVHVYGPFPSRPTEHRKK